MMGTKSRATAVAHVPDAGGENLAREVAAVSVRGLCKRFGKKEVLRSLDLEVSRQQITGLLGPSGCGKTTLVNQIVGLSHPSSGSVTVFGEKAGSRCLRSTLGFMPQSEALYQDLDAMENLLFFGALYGIGAKTLKRRAQSLLETMRLADTGHTHLSRFSGGMKRRLSLAVALLHEPQLLVLDEPTVGLDPVLRLELWAEFRRLVGAGTTILVTTHVMDEASSCDSIIMLREGQMIAQDSPVTLIARSKTENLEQAFLVLSGEQNSQARAATPEPATPISEPSTLTEAPVPIPTPEPTTPTTPKPKAGDEDA